MNNKRDKEEHLHINMQSMNNNVALQLHYDHNKLELESESFYPLSVNQIDKIFESYMKGNREGELEGIKLHGGINGLVEKLKTDRENGLQGKEEANKYIRPHDEFERIKQFLDNVKIEAPLQSCCEHAWDALKDVMIRLLIFAAIVQIILGTIPQISEDPSKEWVEGFSIIVAVSVVVSVGSITNWSKEKAFKELNKRSQEDLEVSLVRNGLLKQFHPDNILVGDLLNFSGGKTIPVDGIIISASDVEMDESPLTGESNRMKKIVFEEVLKSADILLAKNAGLEKLPSCLVFSGTKCVKGRATMLVMRVGKNSEIGKIEGRVSAENSKNTLETKLDALAGDIGKFGICAALVTLFALLIRFGVSYSSEQSNYKRFIEQMEKLNITNINPNMTYNLTLDDNTTIITNALEDPGLTVGRKILKIILLCIAIIVVSIPEGLPLAVTLSLAFAIARMQKQQNLVRSMTSCETMGSANYVCTDKTGTLTKNVMKIEMFYNLEDDVKVSNIGLKAGDEYGSNVQFAASEQENGLYSGEKLSLTQKKYKIDCDYQKLVEQALTINISISSEVKDGKKQLTKDCNPTDKSFYDFIQDSLKTDYFKSCEKYFSDSSTFKVIPFTSETKSMTTAIKHREFAIDGYRVFIKGGPDVILPKAKCFFSKETNKAEPLTESKINKINKTVNDYASESLRTIGFAYKDIDQSEFEKFEELDQSGKHNITKDDFILLGIVGIKDPLKEGVLEAVSNCKKSGINVVMVTGDNIVTARAIARECGIINDTQNEILKKELEKEDQKRKLKTTEKIEKSNIALLGPEFSSLVGLICDNEGCKKPTVNVGHNTGNKAAGSGVNKDDEIDLCKCYISEFEKEKTLQKFPNDQILREKKIRKEVIADQQIFEKIISNLRIIARAQPVDKYILVLGLKELGNVVAVTGDGTNDAQALSKADVGFAMGKAGTDIAKDASDIILLDDNFASIITAVKYGRNIFDCIQKFIQFQLTVNICACMLVFITACIGNETPLTAIQMLWVNLIMDSIGSLALATEPPHDKKLLNRRPYGRNEYIVNKTMWKHIIIQSLVELALMLFLYLYGSNFIREDNPKRIAEAELIYLCYGMYPGKKPDADGFFILDGSANAWPNTQYLRSGYGVEECGNYGTKTTMYGALSTYELNNGNSAHMTMIFNTFVVYTLFNQVNARTLDDDFNMCLGIHKNLYHVFIELGEAGLHVVLIQFGGSVFKVNKDGLTGYQWAICIGFSAITFIANFIGKLFMRHNNTFVYNETVVSYEDEKRLFVNVIEKNSLNNHKYVEDVNPVKNSKSIFNPSNIRNSSKKQESLKKHFPKQ